MAEDRLYEGEGVVVIEGRQRDVEVDLDEAWVDAEVEWAVLDAVAWVGIVAVRKGDLVAAHLVGAKDPPPTLISLPSSFSPVLPLSPLPLRCPF